MIAGQRSSKRSPIPCAAATATTSSSSPRIIAIVPPCPTSSLAKNPSSPAVGSVQQLSDSFFQISSSTRPLGSASSPAPGEERHDRRHPVAFPAVELAHHGRARGRDA